MAAKRKKQFFQKHAKSSAALVSLGIHAVLIVVALSFVAVTVINKEEQSFEAKPVNRPKMQLKKLQVPVNIKKKKMQKPKLRKRIVVQPKMNQPVPDIKMPEITGVKGGVGNAGGGGLGSAAGLGFSMPEIEVFGVKSKGEKVFIVLDSSPWMMYDSMGGIPAYSVIKEELVSILGSLNPTVLFNIAVFDKNKVKLRFPNLVAASSSNVAKVNEWLEPLNAVNNRYGLGTLGDGGTWADDGGTAYASGPVQRTSDWGTAAMVAMQQQADTVFVLTQGWGWQFHVAQEVKPWSEAKKAEYERKKKEAHRKLAEDNKKRVAKGMPPQVLVGHSVINKYFPGTEHPPQDIRYWYTPKEMYAGLASQRKESKPKDESMTSGLGRRSNKKEKFSINVIQFASKDYDTDKDSKKQGHFQQLVKYANGSYKTLAGLEAIQDSASSGSGE